MVTETENVIQTVGLTKVFRDFWLREKVTAVKDLNFSIRRGEVYGLLGPNGSGKSTTLKLILGLMFPSSGRVTIFGKRSGDVSVKARIGFLPEESYLYPFLDAYETLDYYGRLFHQPRAQRKARVEMLLDMVGLRGMGFRRVGEYSKGMQRRIGMAQALINDPDLLILDEPTSGMDPLAARQFKDLIVELSRRGKTIVLSSHLLADMEDVCHRVGILYAGVLRSQGTLDELLARTNLTQITSERLDDATAGEMLEVLRRHGKQLLAVESPRDRLESLFLRIIQAAQAKGGKPAGAVETGQLAQFLRGEAGADDGQKIIDELVSARFTGTGPVALGAKPAQPGGTGLQPVQGGAESGTGSKQAPAPAAQADWSVLEQLAPKPVKPLADKTAGAGSTGHKPVPDSTKRGTGYKPVLPEQVAGLAPASPPAPPADRGVIDALIPKKDSEK